MGRSSAGGGGGGRSSGGRSSGSRSFGGRSSSSRSSRSSGSSFSSSSSGSSYHRHYHSHSYYGGRGGAYSSSAPARETSPEEMIKQVFILLYIFWAIGLVVVLVATFIFKTQSPSYQREPLARSLSTETQYVVDNARWGVADRDMSGMKYFYKKTGVQPIILLEDHTTYPESKLTDAELEAYLTNKYNELCTDEGHALFMYWDDGLGNFDFYWLVGNRAKTVIDDEACDIVFSCFDNNATSDMSDSQFVSISFRQAAGRIMRSPNSWVKIPLIGLPLLIVVFIVLVCLHVSMHKKRLRVAEMEAAASILSQNTEDLKMD